MGLAGAGRHLRSGAWGFSGDVTFGPRPEKGRVIL